MRRLFSWVTHWHKEVSTLLCLMLASCASAVVAQDVPRSALVHKAALTRIAHSEWGLDAPVATFAAQIHQESGWNPDAVSRVGALGMAQFMPATSKWWCERNKVSLADCQPQNPHWAMRSLVQYDRWLYNQIRANNHCHRIAMTLSSYNGGLGWLWGVGQTGRVKAGRAGANFRENRDYPRRILLRGEPRYVAAGWGLGSCTGEVLR